MYRLLSTSLYVGIVDQKIKVLETRTRESLVDVEASDE